MTSTPAVARASSRSSRMSPSRSSMRSAKSAMFSRRPVEKLSRMRTPSPRAISARAIDEPMNPAPPVTRYRPMASAPLREPRGPYQLPSRLGGKAADHAHQRRVVDLGRQRRKRDRRIAEALALIAPIVARRRGQRPDRQPRRDEKRRDYPEKTRFCRHGPTVSHLSDTATFSLLPSLLPETKMVTASWYRKADQTGPERVADAARRAAG